jgi:hypothetical protein
LDRVAVARRDLIAAAREDMSTYLDFELTTEAPLGGLRTALHGLLLMP